MLQWNDSWRLTPDYLQTLLPQTSFHHTSNTRETTMPMLPHPLPSSQLYFQSQKYSHCKAGAGRDEIGRRKRWIKTRKPRSSSQIQPVKRTAWGSITSTSNSSLRGNAENLAQSTISHIFFKFQELNARKYARH